jgi:glycosyltransferase involved in cell wall biosynthesis
VNAHALGGGLTGDLRAAPRVVIVTWADGGEGLAETARSLIAQSFAAWQWNIVAPDERLALSTIAPIAEDPRIVVVVSAADLPAASVVVRLEPGDELAPTTLEKWVWALEAHEDWAFVDAVVVDTSAPDARPAPVASSADALVAPEFAVARAAIRRSVWDAVGGNRADGADMLGRWDFWFRVAKLQRWGGTIPEPLVRRLSDPIGPERAALLAAELRRRYPRLWRGDRPRPRQDVGTPNEWVPDELPFENPQPAGERLLLVVPWLELGGADKFNLDLIRYLTGEGWTVTIASTLRGGSAWLDEFTKLTTDVFQLAEFLPRRDQPRFLRYLIESRGIDTVLVANSEFGYRMLPYLRSRFPRATFADYCHSDSPVWNEGGYPRFSVEYQDQLDLTIVSCSHLRRWMVDRGADESRIEVCYIGADPAQFAPVAGRGKAVRRRLGISPEAKAVLFVGRVAPDKQPRVLGRVTAALVERSPGSVVVIAGDGPDLASLRSYVSRHGIDERVKFLGSVAHRELPGLFDASDVFFLPSLWEGIALTAYEAMASGVPVVAADVGGQAELVTPETGVLLPRSDEATEAHAYSEVLAALLGDDARRAKMGRAARERIETGFRLDAMGPRMIELFGLARKLASEQPRQPPTVGLGLACASAAVEYGRAIDRSMAGSGLLWPIGEGGARRRAAFVALGFGSMMYRYGLTHGMTWLTPLRDRLRRVLLRVAG